MIPPALRVLIADEIAADLLAPRCYHRHDTVMRAVITSNDPVRLSFVTSLLADAGIRSVLLDGHASITEGSAGAIRCRLIVASNDFDKARRILVDCGEWD